MGKLFSPKMPKIQKPDPVPQIDEALKNIRDKDEVIRRGRGAEILTGQSGLANLGTTKTPSVKGY